MTVPAATDELRVDYYAGAVAILAAILFAKFVAHRGKSGRDAKESRRAHWFCVILAGLGVIACLSVLGWAKPNSVEGWLRFLVAGLTLAAGAILLYDVTFGPGQKAQTRWSPCRRVNHRASARAARRTNRDP
jgi:protein-S-isoprenylcysteine O-methyltransferase Ste14